MGYETNYQVSVDDQSIRLDDELESVSKYSGWDNGFLGAIKWYDHDADMRKLSKQWPKATFTVHGEGEDNLDLWDEYFVNGKMQRCEAVITYPQFDRKKLR